jgi:hypothetical protein
VEIISGGCGFLQLGVHPKIRQVITLLSKQKKKGKKKEK